MNRFWETIILPIFEEINPQVIVEIGADYGLNTCNILKYCVNHNSKLISIDPQPKFNVSHVKGQFGDKFQMIEDLSLNYISEIESCDIVLIDGDHNWYTVYNELKLLEKKFTLQDFPLIILHDVSWPYGRRDLYYNPESIPLEFRHEFKQLGMSPNQNELLPEGGINHNLNNATTENTPKNGVLTAIEDFLKETTLNLSFYKINGFHGLGIIYCDNDSFSTKLDNIVYDSEIGEIVEKFHINNSIQKNLIITTQKNQIRDLNNKIQEYEQEINNLKLENDNYSNHIDSLNAKNEILNERIIGFEQNKNNLISENESLIERNLSLSSSNEDLISENESLIERNLSLSSSNDALNGEKRKLTLKVQELTHKNKNLISKKKSWKEYNNSLFRNIKELNEVNEGLISEKEMFSAKINELNEVNEGLMSEKQLLNAKIQELTTTQNTLISEMDSLVDRNVVLLKSNSDLISERDSLVDRNVVLTHSKQELSTINDDLKNKFDDIVNSNSWKITSPLRKTKRIFEK